MKSKTIWFATGVTTLLFVLLLAIYAYKERKAPPSLVDHADRLHELVQQAKNCEKEIRPRAEAGDAEAQVYYGKCVARKDRPTEAIKWFRLAADHGVTMAYFHIGETYQFAMGDTEEAMKWYRLASDAGVSKASYRLGEISEALKLPDLAAAAGWYRLAAEQGHTLVLYRLGMMYQDGIGVPQDLVQSYMWYRLSASESDRKALTVKMTPQQIAEAERLAAEWKRAHKKD